MQTGLMDREQYDSLLGIVQDVLDPAQSISGVEISEAVINIFGNAYYTNPAASTFQAYFNELHTHEENIREGKQSTAPVPPQFDGTSDDSGNSSGAMELDSTPEPTPQLSSSLLQATTLSIKQERAHKAADRVHGHANSCKALQHYFLTEASEVSAALQSKATVNVLANNGQGAAHLRANPQAWKAADPYHKRTPALGMPLPTSLSSSSTLSMPIDGPEPSPTPSAATAPMLQTTVEGNWGQTKMTSVRQTTIDYFLLLMIICCALAFSLLDNGFFIDFCLALCPTYAVPDHSSFFTKHIAAELEYVINQLKIFLAQFIHLTLSFDGWSSKAGDKIYTVHVTMPTHMLFLVAGLVMTGFLTDAE
ncbi:hypothetical protein FB451DRAFT_1184716 [Mycena latifolia]|nr:hypothetical protein FB451DRAFT_1184716 [Mycena latifolia]